MGLRHGVTLCFIRPGKPVENAYIESFNGKFRNECLNEHWFVSLADAKAVIETWRIDYNTVRPHSSLTDRTPAALGALWVDSRGATGVDCSSQRVFQAQLHTLVPPMQRYGVSADGQRFLMFVPLSTETVPPITVLLNWQAALKK